MTAKGLPNDEMPAKIASAWRADAIQKAERPDDFWRKQQVQIRQRIESRLTPKPRRFWLTAATAALIFIAVLLVTPAGQRPQPTPPPYVDADQELLLAIERALDAGTPAALDPLTLMVESSSNHNEVEPTSHKEHGHEN